MFPVSEFSNEIIFKILTLEKVMRLNDQIKPNMV